MSNVYPRAQFDYVEITISSLRPRIENCDGKEPGSPGIDCGGPLHTVSVAPSAAGAPLYVSAPYFDSRLFAANKTHHQKAARAAAYNPIGRVSITRCAGNEWCDDHGFGKANTSLWVHTETGLVFRAQVATQTNTRIGFTKSMLHPRINDALVPVYWVSEKVIAPVRIEEQLVTLQAAPFFAAFWLVATFFFWFPCCAVCTCCCVCALEGNERTYKKAQAMLQ